MRKSYVDEPPEGLPCCLCTQSFDILNLKDSHYMNLVVYVKILYVLMNFAKELSSRREKERYDAVCEREPLKPATNDDRRNADHDADACVNYLRA